jgi:glutamine amidotransferase
MCRLFGMQATHPTRIDCELLESQNALIHQARGDQRGIVNADGWGIGLVLASGAVECARQPQPAYQSEDYRAEAARSPAVAAIAHVRAATVGGGALENTHPFRHGDALFAHNGDVPRFDAVKPLLLERLDAEHRELIAGETDSEHLFALLLMLAAGRPGADRRELLRELAAEAGELATEAGASVEDLYLNLLWTVGPRLAGTRLRSSLWWIERDQALECGLCGQRHAHPPEGEPYRSVVVASERITDEDWTEVPDGSVFAVEPDLRLAVEPL